AYAAERGIRVVPEFDIPGHSTSWVVSHPELASLPGPYGIERQWGVFNPVLDPTNEATYALLGDFLGEMAALFPDSFMHIGGDENNGAQWSANPRIQEFIRAHGLKDNGGLHTYFNGRIAAILAKSGKRLVGWDEILHPGLPPGSVVHSWRGTEALAAAAALGYDGILSNGYYVNLCFHASEHYLVDPIPSSSALTPAQRSHILGGEATMWGEWVTPETIDMKIWPRTAAIAERLWSPQECRDVEDMYRRLAIVSDRLDEAGGPPPRHRGGMVPPPGGARCRSGAASSSRSWASRTRRSRRARSPGTSPEPWTGCSSRQAGSTGRWPARSPTASRLGARTAGASRTPSRRSIPLSGRRSPPRAVSPAPARSAGTPSGRSPREGP